ncbi:GNAT family N-acetyltransferase [Hyphomicrobium sp.]|uniref:GNAT family N-acetyltransferase n=1 Tax=Hyphomicrobium sp. TaxID=82 RepID=UPI0025C3D9E8|nr:GNAT family N-acetyltransferase [Hyphomicrobium sp.]MCC7254155.1 GNAT family N-acetyltransferase [Hyphomicrobium sp.]
MRLKPIRTARIDEAPSLTRLSVDAAKSLPRYDDALLERHAPALEIDLPLLSSGLTYVAEAEDGSLLGVMALAPTTLAGFVLLERLFVDPRFHRIGIGTELFSYAVDRANRLRRSVMVIYAHPAAAGFYTRLGAIEIGVHPFHLSPEIKMPILVRSIPSSETSPG